MLKHFDHVTVAVTDIPAAVRFFGLLGFELDKDVVISGPVMDRYMGIDNLEARHVTLALRDAEPRCEVQLLHFNRPTVTPVTTSPGWTASASITSALRSMTSTGSSRRSRRRACACATR